MRKRINRWIALATSVLMLAVVFPAVALSEMAAPAQDPSPAIYVAQKTASSVVGVITQTQTWQAEYRQVQEVTISMGSGVVIRDGGYILTNSHVIEDGSAYKILMPDGEKVEAALVGNDTSTDIAVLKITDAEAAARLTPVEIGASTELLVGSTVVAIGNPGGETLANTVTQGVVSALERNTVSSSRTSREIAYIQHDAAINSGNSGGGLFNHLGQLVGVNTLKYAGSVYSSVTFEGLGFAIPVETAAYIANDLIEYGKVRRATMGVVVTEYANGPDEPMANIAPSGVYITEVVEDTPAAEAGFKQYDCIYSFNGVRVGSYAELTTQQDNYTEGDTVTVEVVRYREISPATVSYGVYGSTTVLSVSGGYDIVPLEVTLAYLDLN